MTKKEPFDGLKVNSSKCSQGLGIMPVPTNQTESLIIQTTQKDLAPGVGNNVV